VSAARVASASVLYVVPTLGERPHYLAETLRSLLTQHGEGVGVVLVAPPGADAVRALADVNRVGFVEQRGSGISNAINEGWSRHGDGYDFWAWLGDDDLLTPDSAGRAVSALRGSPHASMVYGRCVYVDGDGNAKFVVRPTTAAARLLRWGPDLVPQPGSVARASHVRLAGFLDENLRYAMDLDLFLRLKDVGDLLYIPAVLAKFRWHAGSTTVASAADSRSEARTVRRRTWVGRRRVGYALEPLAMLVGRACYRLQRRVERT
jgi:GT2 family glycosyltransferase